MSYKPTSYEEMLNNASESEMEGNIFAQDTAAVRDDAMFKKQSGEGDSLEGLRETNNPKDKNEKGKDSVSQMWLLNTLQNQLNNLNASIAALNEKISDKKDEITISRQRIETINGQLGVSDEQHTALEGEITALETQRDELITEEKDVKTARDEAAIAVQETKTELNTAVTEFEQKTEDAPKSFFSGETMGKDENGNYYTVEENGDIEQQSTVMNFIHWGAEKIGLKSEATDLRPGLKHVNECRTNHARASQEHQQLHTRYEEITQELKTTETQLENLNEKLSDLDAKIADLKTNLGQERTTLSTLETELAQMEEERDDLITQRDQTQNQIANLGQEQTTILGQFNDHAPVGYSPEYGEALNQLKNMNPSLMNPEFLKSFFTSMDPDLARRVMRDGMHYIPEDLQNTLTAPEIFGGAGLSKNNIPDSNPDNVPTAKHTPQSTNPSYVYAAQFNTATTQPAPNELAPKPGNTPSLDPNYSTAV